MEPEKSETVVAPSKPKINKLKLAVVLISITVIVILVLQNREHVDTHVLFAKVTMPHAVLLTVTTGIGFLAGFLVATFRKRK